MIYILYFLLSLRPFATAELLSFVVSVIVQMTGGGGGGGAGWGGEGEWKHPLDERYTHTDDGTLEPNTSYHGNKTVKLSC